LGELLKLFILFYFFILFNFASDFLKIEPLEFTIESVDLQTKKVTFNANSDNKLIVGETAIILKTMKYEHQAIISVATITSIDNNNKATAIFSEFKNLQQDAFPHGKWQPHQGDKLIFRLDYNHILVISDSYSNYNLSNKQILKLNSDFEIIHSDILSATLYSQGNDLPEKESIQRVCRIHNIGLISLNIKNNLYFYDCNSFKLIKKTEISYDQENKDQKMFPFYSRVKTYQTELTSDKEKRKEFSYEKFFKKLFVVKN
jgi:hypothetical protein